MKHKVQQITNGLLVTNPDNSVTYYDSIQALLSAVTEPIKENYLESKNFKWNGEFSISISFEGLVK